MKICAKFINIFIKSHKNTKNFEEPFANDYDPEDFAMSNMNSFLRNEKIAKVLYLCKDVESFGTGFNKIYSLCKKANVKLGYNKYDEYFNFIPLVIVVTIMYLRNILW